MPRVCTLVLFIELEHILYFTSVTYILSFPPLWTSSPIRRHFITNTPYLYVIDVVDDRRRVPSQDVISFSDDIRPARMYISD